MVDPNILSDTTGALSLFGRELRGAANAGVAMAGELLNANQSLSAYTSALEGNSAILGTFGKVINGLTKFAEESLAEYQTLSGIGASFGKEMSNIKISAAELGLSVKDMTDLFMQNSDALRTFGGTTDTAIQNFTRISRSLLDSNAGTELRRLGFTAADINENLMVYNELAQQDGLNRTRSTQQQIEGARNFAVELDGLAKLTGKQRKELADEMKSRRREGDVQAFLMGQSAEAQEAFMMATQKIKDTMGPQFEALFQDLMIRGAPITEETRNAFIALGGSADEFEATVAAFKGGMQTGNFDNFNESLTGAQGAFLDYLKTDEARTIAMQSGLSGVADAMGAAYDSSYNFANAVDASADGARNSAAAIETLQQQISEQQLTQMETTGNLLDKTVQMQEALREFTIAATTEVLPRLEAMAVKGIDMFLERMPSADQLAAQLAGGVQSLFDRLDERTSGSPFINELPAAMADLVTAGDGQITDAITETATANGAAAEAAAADSETRDTELANATQALADAQAEASAAREAAEAALTEAQASLADLTEQGFTGMEPPIRQARERVEQAEATLQNAIDAGNAQVMQAVQASATAFTNSQVASFQSAQASGRRFLGGFAEGGSIGPSGFGIVGEAGPEFVNGPANVTSARESMSVMQNLLKGIKALDTNVQTQAQNTATAISNTRDSGNVEKKYDTMISLLSQLVNVELSASNTAQRTYRATKGLQGNMIRGLGV